MSEIKPIVVADPHYNFTAYHHAVMKALNNSIGVPKDRLVVIEKGRTIGMTDSCLRLKEWDKAIEDLRVHVRNVHNNFFISLLKKKKRLPRKLKKKLKNQHKNQQTKK